MALVAAPGITEETICDAIMTHCESSKFRFAVLDSVPHVGDPSKIDPRGERPSGYAAYYFPWVMSADLKSGVPRLVPPGGHVLGIYARTDIERGVFKAPANEIVRGVVRPRISRSTTAQQGVLNPRGVNAIRRFPGRGIRVWGARTLIVNRCGNTSACGGCSSSSSARSTRARNGSCSSRTTSGCGRASRTRSGCSCARQWRNGALMGLTEDEAFSITCDRSTMTQDDILNGRLICEIGIAPVRPAEFVIFRIFQNTAEAQTLNEEEPRHGTQRSPPQFPLPAGDRRHPEAAFSEVAIGETTTEAIDYREGTEPDARPQAARA